MAILLVDGDPLQAHLRTSLLERQFGEVRRVDSAAEALCLVEQPQFAAKLDLVITGHHLPGLAGPEFIAELHDRLPKLQVLVLGNGSAAANEYNRDDVRYLPGPNTGEQMCHQVGLLLSQKPPQP